MEMKTGIFKKAVCLFISVLLILTFTASYTTIFAADKTVNEVNSLIGGVLAYRQKQSGAKSIQELINTDLTANAGIDSEWYIFALRQYEKGYDFTSYRNALEKYVSNNEENNAVTREKFALLLAASGYKGSYISQTLENSAGKLGIMSWVYALHLINNGYTCKSYTVTDVTEKLLEKRLPDGGWAITGTTSDVDVTSMVIQALAPAYNVKKIKSAIDEAVTLLSSHQTSEGRFTSYGTENAESVAQVITALCSLNIDCLKDNRFIKNGVTLLDVLKSYRLSDGSFSHTEGGESNFNATVQSLYSLVSLYRYKSGLKPLYIISDSVPQTPVTTTKKAVQTTEPTTQKTQDSITNTASSTNIQTTQKISTEPSQEESSTQNVSSTATSTQSQTTSEAENTSNLQVTTSENTTVENSAAPEAAFDKSNNATPKYKIIISVLTISTAISVCLILRSRGKAGRLSYIIISITAAAILLITFTTDIQSKDNYYSATTASGEDSISVTISIRCDTLIEKEAKTDIPSDGIILDNTELSLKSGSTVYDALVQAAKLNGIHLENNAQTGNNYASAYITGINYIYEFDYGDLSGWVYHVNGVSPSVGCGGYTLSEGDKIEWLYTCDLGEDVK